MPVPTSVSQLIEGSGNNFHAKVARWFHSNGWHVVVSPYYLDQVQAKARELDLVVEKLWPITGGFSRLEGDVLVRLFVECKFVSAESVFWFSDKNMGSATALVCSFGPFRKDNTYTEKHHYLATSPKVAKIFASNNVKAPENEPFYKALNQALNGTIALRSQAPSHPSLTKGRRGKLVTLDYPVVVCSTFAQLYGVDFLAASDPATINENFQLEVQYAFLDRSGKQRDDYFLLDFVEFDRLPAFEAVLDVGANAAAYMASTS